MAAKQLKNAIQHKLTVNLLATDVTATWDSVAGWPTLGDFIIRLDDVAGTKTEFVKCTAVNVGALQTTIVRGQESTAGTAFAINDLGTNDLTAQMLIDAFVRLDTSLSQTLTGPLVVPTTLGGAAAATSYGSMPLKLAETLLVAGAATVVFSSIPATFRHLIEEWYARGDAAAIFANVLIRFNNISTASYDYQVGTFRTASALASETLGATFMQTGTMPANTATANYFGQGRIEIKNYAGTTGNKLVTAQDGYCTADTTGTQQVDSYTGKWRTVATAINELDLLLSAGNFVIGSLFTLYGVP